MAVNLVSDPSKLSLNYDKPNISDIILAVGLELMETSNAKLTVCYKQMQQTNWKMQNLNAAMAVANANATTGTSTKGEGLEKISYIDLETGDSRPGSVLDVIHDIAKDDLKGGSKVDGTGALTKQNWQDQASRLKVASDNLGSTSQMEMMKMQSVVNKLNEVTQAVSNNMNKFNQMLMAVIGNMR
jgi:hypothetical protein